MLLKNNLNLETKKITIRDNEDYIFIRDYFDKFFSEIILRTEIKKAEIISKYKEFVLNSLDNFADGNEINDVSFYLMLRIEEESLCIDFSSDGNSFNIQKFATYYYDDIGHDTEQIYSFDFWNDGETEGYFYFNIDNIVEMLNLGAKLVICDSDDFNLEDD